MKMNNYECELAENPAILKSEIDGGLILFD